VSPLPLVHGNRPAAHFVTTRTHRRRGWVVTDETPQAPRGQRDENRGALQRERGHARRRVLLASGMASRPKPIASPLAIVFTQAGDLLSLRCLLGSNHHDGTAMISVRGLMGATGFRESALVSRCS
jgi:hypothetical protein